MVIAILILIIVCIILSILLFKKKQVDINIDNQNKRLETENNSLKAEFNKLKADIDSITMSIVLQRNHYAENQKVNEELENRINNNRAVLQNTIEQNQEISETAFNAYYNTLEKAYQEIEEVYDMRKLELEDEFEEVKKDLDKIKATRAAAYQAILKEQEVKDNKDLYRLILPENERRDIRLLNSIKKELINERPVNMIIWQTYYSKRANELCSRILGTSNKMGIYKITQISTDKCYIGQSKNIKDRFRDHMKCGLGIDTPAGNKLYKAMLDSSIEDFTFELIEECSEKDLDEKEKYFISLYQSYDYGFNSNRGNTNGKS